MQDTPQPPNELRHLRFLRLLVTALTAVMIFGLLAIVTLLIIRFSAQPAVPELPASINLPANETATAFTQGTGWFAVVSDANRIHIYDARSGRLIQSIDVKTAP